MELFILGVGIAILLCIVMGIAGIISALLTLLYGKFYYDNSESTGLRKWTMFRYMWVWNLLRAYVSFEIRDAATDQPIHGSIWKSIEGSSGGGDNGLIFGCHPHGLIPLGPLLAFGAPSDAHFPRKSTSPAPRLLVHRFLFAIPFLRDFCLWIGCLDVSEAVMLRQVTTQQSVALVPAGSQGMIGDAGAETKHQGFLRVAYKCKARVVPCWTPAETRIFKTWDLLPWLRRWAVGITGYPFPTPFIGPLPFKKLVMYIGSPVKPQEYDTLQAFQTAYEAQRLQLKRMYQ